MKEGLVKEVSKYTDEVFVFNYLVKLKLLISFDFKDKNNFKLDFINAYRYSSNKFNNKKKLIKIVRKFKSFLIIEYPNLDGNDLEGRNKNFYISAEDMLGLIDICEKLDKEIYSPFAYKKDKLIFTPSISHKYEYTTIFGDYISFVQAIHLTGVDKEKEIPGVRISISNKYEFTCSVAKWKGFLYNLKKCDLYGWGSVLANNVTCNIDELIVEFDNTFQSNQDKENIKINKDSEEQDNASNDSKINKSKPLSKRKREESFFD